MVTNPIRTICIVGAGFMGSQIELQCASYGYTAWIVGHSEKSLNQTSKSQTKELDERIKKSRLLRMRKRQFLIESISLKI